MKAIRIRSAKEFEELLDSLCNECVWTRTAFRQHFDIHQELNNNLKLFEAAKFFWTSTLHAHHDFVLARLCRLYDQHTKSLSLPRLLLTIQDHLEIFDKLQFCDRNKDDPFLDALATQAGRPDEKQLAKDIEETSAKNPLVGKLLKWRNEFFAHMDPRHVIATPPPAACGLLNYDEMSDLVERANDILINRYRKLFKGSTTTGVFMGALNEVEPLLRSWGHGDGGRTL